MLHNNSFFMVDLGFEYNDEGLFLDNEDFSSEKDDEGLFMDNEEENFSKDPNHIFIDQVGKGESFPWLRITYINGILTTPEKCRQAASYISEQFQSSNVHFVCDQTSGALKDVFNTSLLLIGNEELESVDKLTELFKRCLKEVGETGGILHFAHSRGGLVTKAALQKLSQSEKERINVISLGSPAIISEEDCFFSKNISNAKDPVPFVNPGKWIRYFFPGKNDKIISSKNLVWEHGVMDIAYSSEIRMIANNSFF